jgi:hypothetical protein
MDNLDKISIIILIVLAAVMVVIGMDYHGGAESNVSNAAVILTAK